MGSESWARGSTTPLFLNSEPEDFLTSWTTLLLSWSTWLWFKLWFTKDGCGCTRDCCIWPWTTWDCPWISWETAGWKAWEICDCWGIWDCWGCWGCIFETCIGGIDGMLCLLETLDWCPCWACVLLRFILILERLSPNDWANSLLSCSAVSNLFSLSADNLCAIYGGNCWPCIWALIVWIIIWIICFSHSSSEIWGSNSYSNSGWFLARFSFSQTRTSPWEEIPIMFPSILTGPSDSKIRLYPNSDA